MSDLGVADDLALEAILYSLAPHQFRDVADADVVLEPLVAPFVERVDYVLHLGHPGVEVSFHVLLKELHLGLYVLRGLEVVLQQADPLLHGLAVTARQLLNYPERALQLQPDPAFLVQQVRDVLLQSAEVARLQ